MPSTCSVVRVNRTDAPDEYGLAAAGVPVLTRSLRPARPGRVTPSARVSAAIALLGVLEEQCFAPGARRRPADAVAADFFRERRFIGGGDRRAVAEHAWGVVRQRLRLDWHLARIGMAPTPRLLLLAQMLLAQGRRRPWPRAPGGRGGLRRHALRPAGARRRRTARGRRAGRARAGRPGHARRPAAEPAGLGAAGLPAALRRCAGAARPRRWRARRRSTCAPTC